MPLWYIGSFIFNKFFKLLIFNGLTITTALSVNCHFVKSTRSSFRRLTAERTHSLLPLVIAIERCVHVTRPAVCGHYASIFCDFRNDCGRLRALCCRFSPLCFFSAVSLKYVRIYTTMQSFLLFTKHMIFSSIRATSGMWLKQL